jgi:hypothetical protein
MQKVFSSKLFVGLFDYSGQVIANVAQRLELLETALNFA